ncbi:hypothetical protein EB796_018191 [Bugula neritina]|uniref:Uncharacterized protein n=1 Tax=Bugula neritina TaxID=10212 RepID=A0A7J7JCW6_BUGNE|nr:hypothetical protein EB796_018191 [Bugula neritina]
MGLLGSLVSPETIAKNTENLYNFTVSRQRLVNMGHQINGEVVNYKYWQTLKPTDTIHKENIPSKEAIEFERYLQMLEGENRLYEMGLAMKKANQEKSRDTVCSIEALVADTAYKRRREHDSKWYLTKDQLVDSEEDIRLDNMLATVELEPEYQPVIKKIELPVKNEENGIVQTQKL